ncbi:hypothetical protein B296_00056756 [Ensete ventricosum]|uniref:MORF/ORRM1/DAG-like MORF domain-containing protein n=1 Tax=Ensete ventricosum TaxID=4639 RepID=A0A426X2M1_ENSVE|nr:hypothetical protein B296_00056756 [Ensete ventricosum]
MTASFLTHLQALFPSRSSNPTLRLSALILPRCTLASPFRPVLNAPFSCRRRAASCSWAIRGMAVGSDYSSRRVGGDEPRETILLPGCDYKHWLIVMEFPKDPAPTREQMIETYLNTLATVLGR